MFQKAQKTTEFPHVALTVRFLDVHVVMQDKFSPVEQCRRESCTGPVHRGMVQLPSWKMCQNSGMCHRLCSSTLRFVSLSCVLQRTSPWTLRFHLTRAAVIASALRRHDRTNPLGDGRGVQFSRRGANGSMKINKECTAQQTNPMAYTSSLRLVYRELTERVFIVSCQRWFVPARLHWHRSQSIPRHFFPESHEVRRWYPRGNVHLRRVVGRHNHVVKFR